MFDSLRLGRIWACATFAKARSASLTAWAVGNVSATSASRSTRVVPALARRKYFPRTPPLSCVKSYSGRRSSICLRAPFLRGMSFCRSHPPGTDDGKSIVTPVGVRDEQDPPATGNAEGYKPMFVRRGIRVVER